MTQIIRVLQCFDCKTYQVDIVKKAKKWQCKLCGVKQSVKREFFRGSGSDCRLKAQHLNMEKGRAAEQEQNIISDLLENDDFNWNELTKIEQKSLKKSFHDDKKENKWNSYVDDTENETVLNTKETYHEQTFNEDLNARVSTFAIRGIGSDTHQLNMEMGCGAEKERNIISDSLESDDSKWFELTKLEQESLKKSSYDKKQNKGNYYVNDKENETEMNAKATYGEQTFNENINARVSTFTIKRKITSEISHQRTSRKLSKWNDYL